MRLICLCMLMICTSSALLAQGVQGSATHASEADIARLRKAIEEAYEKDLKPKIEKIEAERAAQKAKEAKTNPEMVDPVKAAAPKLPKTNPEDELLRQMNKPQF